MNANQTPVKQNNKSSSYARDLNPISIKELEILLLKNSMERKPKITIQSSTVSQTDFLEECPQTCHVLA